MGESRVEGFALFLEGKQISLTEFDFSKGSTIGVGGVGRAVFPRSFTECIDVIEACRRYNYPYRVLGNLSNVLPPERDDETIYVITKRLKGITMGDAPLVHAGVTASQLLNACKLHGKSGAEFLTGIPCTVGGAAYMNAGVSGRYFAEIVRSVIVYENGGLKTYPKEECGYSYKNSRFMQGGLILAVVLNLENATPETVSQNVRTYANRRAKLPTGKSMGCVFKNPDGISAGALIERAGLKGMRVGGAVVSTEHANFIINEGGATVADVQTLIQAVKDEVLRNSGVTLIEEIERL